jgi:capsular exopolysaccharide synthesis family protein
MSRLYDALKEATGFRKEAMGDAGEAMWDALGVNGITISPGIHPPAPAAAPGLNEAEAVLAELGPATAVAEEPPAAPRAHIPAYGSARLALDRRERLIPHAVDPGVVEHYRRLRTKIMQQQATKPFRTLVVTSANPQEGKTVTVLNLGLTFAIVPGFRVLVVDGDLRRGTMGNWLGIDNRQDGLSNVIDGTARFEDVVWKADDIPLHFMLRGNSRVSPGELLNSLQPTGQLRRISENFDLVLVDSPPVNLLTDVQLLAGSCEAVLLVARAFSTKRKA